MHPPANVFACNGSLSVLRVVAHYFFIRHEQESRPHYKSNLGGRALAAAASRAFFKASSNIFLKNSFVEGTALPGSSCKGTWPCSLRASGWAPNCNSISACLVFSNKQAKCNGVLSRDPYRAHTLLIKTARTHPTWCGKGLPHVSASR